MTAAPSGVDTTRLSLAVITTKRGGDGVAYAGALLNRALAAIQGDQPRISALNPADKRGPTLGEQARFIIDIAFAQLLEPNHWFFNHVGIARAQNLIPAPIRKPYAVLLCGIEAWDPDLSPSRRKALTMASARIAISRYTAERVRSVHPCIGEILVCPLALLPREITSDAVDDSLLDQIEQTSILIVGRMSCSERYKGHDELLECWSLVLQQVPTAQLVVAGTGDDVERLRAKASALGVAEHVLFTGFASENTLDALRCRSAIFALPSRGEGFGLVYLEAMRAGLACIGGEVDAAADVITHGQTGILVNPSNPTQLAAALVGLLTNIELRNSYGAAGKRRFEAEFTFERYCERLRETLATAFE